MDNLNNFIKTNGKKETPFDTKKTKFAKDETKLVKISGEVHKKVKVYVANNGGSMKELIDKAIMEYLK
ncbi:hypothetical protein [Lactococcus sp. dk322]|uniref:hypothetical protein n=1 Tax=Lactococcus sp. dk322 TaxID=2603290 RepID=UPI0011C984C8|nr:hypothetical protein [Lactococcus sp. dk322]TXK45940.1 hypothetical protein FVP43_11200 [Lactococcus sp. dk322]